MEKGPCTTWRGRTHTVRVAAKGRGLTRGPCEHCGAPVQCRRPPERVQGGAGGRQGPAAGRPCDTA
eukprot:5582718-Heterocapsa_arctica.AAC.1